MTITVIIPTYNGKHKIANILRALEKQELMPDEVIVVIDGSTDQTAEMLRKTAFRLPNFRFIEQDNGGRSRVRNRGAAEAKSELLLFLDDDMIVPLDCIKEHIKHHIKYPGTIITGRLEDPNGKTGNDFQKFKSWLNQQWNKNLSKKEDGVYMQLNYPYITAGNFSLNQMTFKQLMGFDERLTDAEDYDLAKRAMVQNIPIYFSHTLYAWHNDNVNCQKYIKRLRQYTTAQKVLVSLKPELYEKENQYTVNPPSGIKGAIFATFCNKWWIDSIDRKYWTWLPKAFRFKLYDMIITANGSFYPEKVPF